MIIFKLIKRIFIHKFWVMYYCGQIGLYWQGIIHDLSKFSKIEFTRAIKYWDDKISSLSNERKIEGYSRTFLHHRGRNPHHYEYWIYGLDKGGKAAKMPLKYVQELVCDYLAACKTYGGNPREELFWWNKCEDKLKIHPDTKSYITNVFTGYNSGKSLKESIKFANKFYGI